MCVCVFAFDLSALHSRALSLRVGYGCLLLPERMPFAGLLLLLPLLVSSVDVAVVVVAVASCCCHPRVARFLFFCFVFLTSAKFLELVFELIFSGFQATGT